MLELIDISAWNTVNNWSALYEAVPGVIIKATEGVSGVDNKFTLHWQDAVNEDMIVMVYHFFRSNADGIQQAQHCWNTIQPLAADLGVTPFVWVDVETVDGVSNSTRISRLLAFLNTFNTLAGPGRVGIYTSPGFANTYLTPTPAWINNYPQWIAHWTAAGVPTMPTLWNNRKLWQYGIWNDHAWCAPVPGCTADIDRDRFEGTLTELQELAGVPTPQAEYVTHAEFAALVQVVTDLTRLVENLTEITPTHIVTGAGSNGEKFRATPGGNERWMVPNGTAVRMVYETSNGGMCEMVYRGRVELGWVDKENLTPI